MLSTTTTLKPALTPLRWEARTLFLLDQTQLPLSTVWHSYTTVEGVVEAIQTMVVRGAPAIGLAAAYGMVLAFQQVINTETQWALVLEALKPLATELNASRPTAVNLMWAVQQQWQLLQQAALQELPLEQALKALEANAVTLHQQDVEANQRMGALGASLLPAHARLLTHCNAGALATGGYGTALGVIRAAYATGKCSHVFADETRPRLQGAQLTAYELMYEGIPSTLICDNMAASLMQQGRIDAILVGADRIAANGDAANKIGTYSLAVVAHYHQVPFYVVAPASTFDGELPTGTGIPIEERSTQEVTVVNQQRLAPEGMNVYNPGFDVTPAHLITAIITPDVILKAPYAAGISAWLGNRAEGLAVTTV
jgi:methylthioribose-1-phosphate isomerase